MKWDLPDAETHCPAAFIRGKALTGDEARAVVLFLRIRRRTPNEAPFIL